MVCVLNLHVIMIDLHVFTTDLSESNQRFTGFLTDAQYLVSKIHTFANKLHHKMISKNVIVFLFLSHMITEHTLQITTDI